MGRMIFLYLMAVNIITFIVFGIDKQRAKNHEWRISEATLIGLAVIGGSVGALLGMRFFRHKTKHKKFTVGIPAILMLQTVVPVLFMVALRMDLMLN